MRRTQGWNWAVLVLLTFAVAPSACQHAPRSTLLNGAGVGDRACGGCNGECFGSNEVCTAGVCVLPPPKLPPAIAVVAVDQPVIHYSAQVLPLLDLTLHIKNTGQGAYEVPRAQCACPGTCTLPGFYCDGSTPARSMLWTEQALDASGNPRSNGLTPFDGTIGIPGDVICGGIPQAPPPGDSAWLGPGCTETVSVHGVKFSDVDLEQETAADVRICSDAPATGMDAAACAILHAIGCGSLSICDGRCVDIMSDPQHCGFCTAPACGSDSQCIAGKCTAPPAPPVYTRIQFTIETGDDDLRADSEVTAIIGPVPVNGAKPLQAITLKRPTDPAWDNNTVHVVTAQLAPNVQPVPADSITIILTSHNSSTETPDNWNVQSVDISVFTATGAATLLWSAAGAPLARLMNGSPCSQLQIPQVPLDQEGPPGTFDLVRFAIGTGADDLRGDSSVTATLYDTKGMTLQVVSVKAQNAPVWSTGTTHVVTARLSPPLVRAAVAKVAITLASHNAALETDDNWDVAAVDVSLSNNGARATELVSRTGSPLMRLTGSTPTASVAVTQ